MKINSNTIFYIVADLMVVIAAVNFLMSDPSDGWHRFTYYLAGMSFGWYCTVRYRQFKNKERGCSE